MAATSSITSIYQPDVKTGRIGCLRYSDGDPLINHKVKLYVHNLFGNYFYGEAVTDSNGFFRIKNPKVGFSTKLDHSLVLRVMYPNHFYKKGEGEGQEYPAAEIKFPYGIKGDIQNLGDVTLSVFDYQEDLPILKLPESDLPSREIYPYKGTLVKVAIDDKIKAAILPHIPCADIPMAEKTFGVGDPNLQLTPQNTIEMLLNGIYPCNFKKTSNPNEIYVDINWDRYERDASPVLPNVKLFLNNDEGDLMITHVMTQFPNEGWETYDQGHPEFLRALYLFNSAAIVAAEIGPHLGTHLRVGEVATAADRHINKNPIGTLLFPHLKATQGINQIGRDPIFGKDGILNVSGLTVGGIRSVLKDNFACFDYSNFKPRNPINKEHTFAMASNLFWSIVNEYIEYFFSQNKQEIEKEWLEIYYFSKYLVDNSVEHRAEDGEENPNIWFDKNEIDDPSGLGRVIVDGKIKAIRPITRSKTGPVEGDMERLKQLCKWTIFMASWWHWVIHSSQKKWVTNLKFATLAPEGRGEGEYGGTKLENAIRTLAIATILTDFDPEEGRLVNNYYGDINQIFINMLLDRDLEFRRYGFNIRKMFYGIIV